jgi:hypothetical protein
VLIDLATFAGLAILYVAHDWYATMLQPARGCHQKATRKQPISGVRLHFATGPVRGDRKAARHRNLALAGRASLWGDVRLQ